MTSAGLAIGSRKRAILLVCTGSALFVVAAALVKAIARDIPVMEIAFFRSLVASIILLPMLRRHGGLQALRLNAGRHQVAIRFDASLFNAGLAACLAGACLLLGLGLAGRRADPRGNSAPHG